MQGLRRLVVRLIRLSRSHLLFLPLLVLASGLLFTYGSWAMFDRAAQAEVQRAFSIHADQTAQRFTEQLVTYQASLQAVRALFSASKFVDQPEFFEFVQSLNFQQNTPGTVALGYVSLSPDKAHAPITYIYPETERNLAILGIDTFSDPLRKATMLNAATSEEPKLSAPVGLFQQSHESTVNSADSTTSGYLLFMPIHADFSSLPSEDPSLLKGWIYIAFRLDQALSAVFDDESVVLDYEVSDVTSAGSSQAIFKSQIANSSPPNGFVPLVAERAVNLFGRSWSLRVLSTRQFQQVFKPPEGGWVIVLGTLVSLFLALLSWLLLGRMRALRHIHRINDRLRQSEQRWKFAMEGAGDGVWDYDLVTQDNHVSDCWKAMLGYEPKDLDACPGNWEQLIHPDDYAVVTETLRDYLKGDLPAYVVEHRMRCKDGSWKWVLARGMVVARDVLSGRPLRMVGTTTDISRMKASEALIWHQANFDALTGIPNRRMFFDRLNTEIKRVERYGGSLTLLFVDLDKFKEINDRYGHQVGDEVLKTVSQRLCSVVRSTDIVARLGGDEFTVILSQIMSESDAENIIEKIREALQEPIVVGAYTFQVSGSIGATTCPQDGTSADDLLNQADRAMYGAKARGFNQWQNHEPDIADIRVAQQVVLPFTQV